MTAEVKELRVYKLASDEIEKQLSARYGNKLAAVNRAKLAKHNERRASWLRNTDK